VSETEQKPKKWYKEYVTGTSRDKTLKPYHYATIDIETDGLGGDFIYGAIYDGNECHYFGDLGTLLSWCIDHPDFDYWAHNGAKYDYSYLFVVGGEIDKLIDQGWRVGLVESGAQVLGFVLTKEETKIQFRDFFRIMPSSLDRLGKDLELESRKLTGTIDFENGERFDPNNVEHLAYLTQDVVSLYEAIGKFRRIFFDIFGVSKMGWSLPSMALQAWRRTIPIEKQRTKKKAKKPVYHKYWRQPKDVREFIRQAYYGGMTIPLYSLVTARYRKAWNSNLLELIPEGENPLIASLDINSSYPASMLMGVPKGRARHTWTYVEGKPGFYKVTAHVPADFVFPYIPYRSETGTEFPRGDFETYVSSLEIEEARTQGVTFDIHEGYYFPDGIEYPFESFVNLCKQIRYEHKGTALEVVAKLAQNSLYGKFGMKESIRKYWLESTDTDSDPINLVCLPNGEIHPYMHSEEETVDEGYLKPEWSAWITAQSRLRLVRVAKPAAEQKRLLYTDTDSVKLIINGVNVDDYFAGQIDEKEYGKWKLEYLADEFVCSAPKTYAVHRLEGYRKNGVEYEVHSKGVPKKLVTFDDIATAALGGIVKKPLITVASLKYQAKYRGKDVNLRRFERALTTPDKVLHFRHINGEFIPKTLQLDEKSNTLDMGVDEYVGTI